ncbi:MAG: HPr family phosphocarrier protein [Muricoprocola sp.]
MVSRSFYVKDPSGLPLKSVADICTESIKYQSQITLQSGNTVANAKSVLNILTACAKFGNKVTLICDGKDETEALEKLGELIEKALCK